MNGQNRAEGIVARQPSNSSIHPHGTKVMLADGPVERGQKIL